jgi:hypothetical protein
LKVRSRATSTTSVQVQRERLKAKTRGEQKETKKKREEQRRTKKDKEKKETIETRKVATINRRKRSRDDLSLCRAIYFFSFFACPTNDELPRTPIFFAAAGEEVQREKQEKEQQ